MGMFTSIYDAEGVEHQIKCGYDICARFKIGNEVPARPDPDSPLSGYLLDDVYDAYSDSSETWTWVIIKDGRIHAVVPRTEDPLVPGKMLDHDDDHAFLFQKFDLKLLPHTTWAVEAWAKLAKLAAEAEVAVRTWKAECVGLTKEEIAAKAGGDYIAQKMQEDGFFRKIMPPLPATDE